MTLKQLTDAAPLNAEHPLFAVIDCETDPRIARPVAGIYLDLLAQLAVVAGRKDGEDE